MTLRCRADGCTASSSYLAIISTNTTTSSRRQWVPKIQLPRTSPDDLRCTQMSNHTRRIKNGSRRTTAPTAIMNPKPDILGRALHTRPAASSLRRYMAGFTHSFSRVVAVVGTSTCAMRDGKTYPSQTSLSLAIPPMPYWNTSFTRMLHPRCHQLNPTSSSTPYASCQ